MALRVPHFSCFYCKLLVIADWLVALFARVVICRSNYLSIAFSTAALTLLAISHSLLRVSLQNAILSSSTSRPDCDVKPSTRSFAADLSSPFFSFLIHGVQNKFYVTLPVVLHWLSLLLFRNSTVTLCHQTDLSSPSSEILWCSGFRKVSVYPCDNKKKKKKERKGLANCIRDGGCRSRLYWNLWCLPVIFKDFSSKGCFMVLKVLRVVWAT